MSKGVRESGKIGQKAYMCSNTLLQTQHFRVGKIYYKTISSKSSIAPYKHYTKLKKKQTYYRKNRARPKFHLVSKYPTKDYKSC